MQVDLVALRVEVDIEGRLECAGGVGLDMGLCFEFALDLRAQLPRVVGRGGDDVVDAFAPVDQGCGLRAVAAMAVTILTVLLSLVLFLWRTSRPHMAIVGLVPGTEHFRNVERHKVVTDPSILTIRVDESLYFANARALEDAIYDRIADQPALKHVVLMCPAVNLIDASALESLEAIAHRLSSAGVGFHLSEVKGPVMDALKRSDFLQHFKGRIFLSQYEAFTTLGGPAR